MFKDAKHVNIYGGNFSVQRTESNISKCRFNAANDEQLLGAPHRI